MKQLTICLHVNAIPMLILNNFVTIIISHCFINFVINIMHLFFYVIDQADFSQGSSELTARQIYKLYFWVNQSIPRASSHSRWNWPLCFGGFAVVVTHTRSFPTVQIDGRHRVDWYCSMSATSCPNAVATAVFPALKVHLPLCFSSWFCNSEACDWAMISLEFSCTIWLSK